jgi:hypothetical protein
MEMRRAFLNSVGNVAVRKDELNRWRMAVLNDWVWTRSFGS